MLIVQVKQRNTFFETLHCFFLMQSLRKNLKQILIIKVITDLHIHDNI